MSKTINNAVVAFCSITKPEGHKNGKHLLGVYVNKKFKKQFEKDFDATWEENKTAKAKKPVYSSDEWFAKDNGEGDKKRKGDLIFFMNAKADSEYGITLKQPEDADFTEEDFGVIGQGSVIDVEYDLYYFNHKEHGEMVLRSIKAVLLKDLVRYEGGDNLDGKAIKKKEKKSEDSDEPKKVKKEKKSKKKEKKGKKSKK